MARMQALMPGGVNSPVRAYKAVGGLPPVIARGQGSRVWDVDGNEYIDYVGAYGPAVLGHAHPAVVEAVQKAAAAGFSFGAPTEAEGRLAELVCAAIPSIDMLRLVSSGTEATMSAIRLARAHSGRDKVIKFEGCYHGHSDGLLAKAGSGLATFAIPGTPGVPAAFTAQTLVLPYNDLDAVRQAFELHGDEIACVIIEPLAANMGLVLPVEGYLAGLRQVTREYGALLVFDEVISGFRVPGLSAQVLYGVTPDLTCLGKVIGGGLPIGAYGGSTELMSLIAPEGPVYQAGTLSGNPLCVAAGISTLELLKDGSLIDEVSARTAVFAEELRETFGHSETPVQVVQCGSLLTPFFSESPVSDFASAAASDTARFARFHRALTEAGVHLPPSQFEAWFVSAAHTREDLARTREAVGAALADSEAAA
jgi:glutamate-1-semialdehyde 2,1-aminomutase